MQMSSTKSKLAPRHMDSSQTPLDRLLHNLHKNKCIDDVLSLPQLQVENSAEKVEKEIDLFKKARNSINSNGGKSITEGNAAIMPSPCILKPKKRNYKKRAVDKVTMRDEKDQLHLRYKLIFSPTKARKRPKEVDMKNKMLSGVKATQHERPVVVSKVLL